MLRRDLLALLLVYSMILVWNTYCVDEETCSIGHQTFPRGSTRKCIVYPRLLWGSPVQQCEDLNQAKECFVYVGMNLIVECEVKDVHHFQLLKDNQTISPRGILTVKVNSSTAGEYECRGTNNGTLISNRFNVSVSTDVMFGLSDFFCNIDTAFNYAHNCCSFLRDWKINDDYFHLHNSLMVYNFKILTLDQEWITPKEEHSHTDLGLMIRNVDYSTGNFDVYVTEKPEPLTSPSSLLVAAIVTAIGLNNDSFSIYVTLEIYDSSDKKQVSVNTSLPMDVRASEGETVMFECSYHSQYAVDNCIGTHIINYTTADGRNQPFNPSCFSENDYSEMRSDATDLYSLNVTIENNVESTGSRSFLYRFYIYNVNETRHNNSILSCALETKRQIQWERSARLYVYPAVPTTEHSVKLEETTLFQASVSVVGGIIVIGIIISAIISVYVILRRSKEESSRTKDPGRASLISCDSDSSDSEDTPIPHSTLQVYSYEGPQRTSLINVMQSWTVRNHGISDGKEHSLKERHRGLDYDDPSSTDSSEHQNNCVYISYTENKADWVYDYLKPLIESWGSQVILHEEDMIPGYTVSGERQRLILQARRVVLVVSSDYSSSPWCLYELQHAITQEPVMFKGRIIPVMVDGCYTLPVILIGIVPLHDSDSNFESKLKMNICGTSL